MALAPVKSKEYQKQYYQKHRDKQIAAAKEYYATHLEQCKASRKAWRLAHRGPKMALQKRTSRLKRRYGLTLEAYHALWEDQKGNCKLCKKPMHKADVDHNHKTNKVRGLVHHKCNLFLGMFEAAKSLQLVELAKDYLEAYDN